MCKTIDKQIKKEALPLKMKNHLDEYSYLHIFAHICQQNTESKVTEIGVMSNWSWKKLQYMNSEVIDIRWKLGEYLTTNGYQYENTYVERKNELTLCSIQVPDSRTAHL